MTTKIKKVVFPIAGFGTRFLPITKTVPKEMLPVGPRPLIQWAVEEAAAIGCREFIFITSPHKPSIAAHFQPAPALEAHLQAQDKGDLIARLQTITPKDARFIEIEQSAPLGLGHAVWCARAAIGNEPFAVILTDDIMTHDTPDTSCLVQMMTAYEDGNMVAVAPVPLAQTANYGVLHPKAETDGAIIAAKNVVEKPTPETAPSQLAVMGRYILHPQIMDYLARGQKGAGGEIQLTDAIAAMLPATPLYGFRFDGVRYDCGTVDGWLAANLAFGVKHGDDALIATLYEILQNRAQ